MYLDDFLVGSFVSEDILILEHKRVPEDVLTLRSNHILDGGVVDELGLREEHKYRFEAVGYVLGDVVEVTTLIIFIFLYWIVA